MDNEPNTLTPRTRTGWIAVALGFGVVVVGLVLFFLSGAVTDGGSESAPLWLRVLVPAAVLAVAVPAVVLGFRSRRTDPSWLGTLALLIAGVLGAWSAFTGVAGFFF
jgi:hypothetical protein